MYKRQIGESWYPFFGLANPNAPVKPNAPDTAGGGEAACPYLQPTVTLRSGSTGEGVKWVQWQLDRLGYAPGSIDGIFGANTDKAVRALQKAAGLAVDGVVGVNTREALTCAGDEAACPYVQPTVTLRSGSTGEGVQWVQWQLDRLGYAHGGIDGIFGVNTDKAVRALQKAAGLAVDGIVGKDTREALRTGVSA